MPLGDCLQHRFEAEIGVFVHQLKSGKRCDFSGRRKGRGLTTVFPRSSSIKLSALDEKDMVSVP